jgi:hypothetical protein
VIKVLNNFFTPIYTIDTDSTRSFTLPIGLSGNYYIQVSSGGDSMMSAPGGTYYITTGFASSEPTYSVSADLISVNEGSEVNFRVSTTNVAPGTRLLVALGGDIRPSDIDSFSLNDFVTIGDNGSASISFRLSADELREGPESFKFTLFSQEFIKLAEKSITVNDTSIPPAYSVSADKSSVNEGDTVTYTITTSATYAGAILSYTLSGINISDLSSGALTGKVTVDDKGKAYITVPLKADVAREGVETILLTVKDFTEITKLAEAAPVTVNDTSTVPAFFTNPPSNLTYREGNTDATDIAARIKLFAGNDLKDSWVNYLTVAISDGYQPGDALTFDSNGYFYNSIFSKLSKNNDVYIHWYSRPLPEIESLLDGLGFISTSDDPTNHGMNTTRTITWTFDTFSSIYETTSIINIIAVNDAPTINTTQSVYKAIGAEPLHIENTGITIADPDSKALSLSLSSTGGKLRVSSGTTGATISQLSETSALISGDVAQINSLLEGTGGASITFDPYVLMNSNGQIQLTVTDGGLIFATASLAIQKQLIQDIFPITGNGGLFGSSLIDIIVNISKINNISLLTNNSPISNGDLTQLISKIEYVNQNLPIVIFSSGPYSAQQNNEIWNIIGSIYDNSSYIINNII